MPCFTELIETTPEKVSLLQAPRFSTGDGQALTADATRDRDGTTRVVVLNHDREQTHRATIRTDDRERSLSGSTLAVPHSFAPHSVTLLEITPRD